MLSRLLFIACLFIASPASAEEIEPGGWLSDCRESYCVFRKTLSFAQTETTFALLEILIDVDTGAASIVLTAPLGVALEPGIRMIVEGREWFAPLKVCYTDGCRATVEISNDDFALLLQKPSIDIRYIPFGRDDPLSAELPLNGLVAAISQMKR